MVDSNLALKRSKVLQGREYLTVPQAAARLNVPRMTMYRWAMKGMAATGQSIEVVKDILTNHYYISRDSVESFASQYPDNLRYVQVAELQKQ